MSVEQLAAEIRRAVTGLPVATLTQASKLVGEARDGYGAVAQGSSSAELAAAVTQLGDTSRALDSVRHVLAEVEQRFERYLAHIGAGSESTASRTPALDAGRTAPSTRPRLSDAGRQLVAEVAERGDKISPDKVVRIEKPDRIVWLEEGNERGSPTS